MLQREHMTPMCSCCCEDLGLTSPRISYLLTVKCVSGGSVMDGIYKQTCVCTVTEQMKAVTRSNNDIAPLWSKNCTTHNVTRCHIALPMSFIHICYLFGELKQKKILWSHHQNILDIHIVKPLKNVINIK